MPQRVKHRRGGVDVGINRSTEAWKCGSAAARQNERAELRMRGVAYPWRKITARTWERLNNDNFMTWTDDVHCTDRVDTTDGNKTEADVDISPIADREDEIDCADFEDGEDEEDVEGNTAYANGTVDAEYAKDTMNNAYSP